MDRRVKLVFADELGRFLLRKRGFSSCWFLVPPSARLVGDLAHEIRHEFGLSVARCPSGVDLVLEQLHLLPSHDIRIVRDNDEICVQCSPVGSSAYALRQRSAELALLEVSSGDEEQQQEKPKKRRDKKEKKTTAIVAATSAKDEKKARKELEKQSREDKRRVAAAARKPDTSEGSSSSSSSDSEEEEMKQPAVPAPKSKKRKAIAPSPPAQVESSNSSSSSSSDSSDSDSDSSSSDSEDESAKKARQPERKRQRVEISKPSAIPKLPLKPTPSKKALGNLNGVGEPRQRRRRRPRNRKPREERTKRPKENGAAVILSAALPVPGHRPANPLAQLPPPVAALPQPDVSPKVQETADAETSSVVKGHVRFGDAGESQVVAKSTANKSNGGDVLNIRKPRAYVSPELKKYGPPETSASRDQQQQQEQRPAASKAPTKQQQQRQQYTNGLQRHQSEPSSAQPLQDTNHTTATKTKKKQWGDMWKRPYEIVATIHDQPDSQSAEARSSVDIPRLLATFPPPESDVSATWFQIGDVVAYKTLTLCMETWQPIASAWLCGKVLSASSSNGASEVEVQPMVFSVYADGESEQLQWTPHTGDSAESEPSSVAIPIGEVSEIRYLEGPSFQTRLGQLPW